MKSIAVWAVVAAVALSACGQPAEAAGAAPSGPAPEVARPYNEAANAQTEIATAVTAARGDGKRVLLVFGANWCVWCRRLEHTLQNDAAVAAAVRDGFHVVHVDTGGRGSGTNRTLNEQYGNPMSNGLPVIVVLDATGRVVMTQETGALEIGNRHDPAKVLQFLQRARS
jgi:thiol:disulfide interchange protein